MVNGQAELTEEQWQAIVRNNRVYDHTFIYAVRTTGIFCKPSCKSRVPNRENVLLFQNAVHAESAQFRPCKRCKPQGVLGPLEEWAAHIEAYINKHYMEPLNLESLADVFHASPYHMIRVFKRVKGLTPGEYIQQLRIKQAKKLLLSTEYTVAEVGSAVGMTNSSYFITVFKKKTGFTPADFRKRR
ncbi:bifunctional transcriptional activator/DNA repair enzyme AdaA [Paenibacillus swuensis]|nr:bifunctional transcriptional activator/DNA repair enzyme AdaA [Paenibacillus swuensis]